MTLRRETPVTLTPYVRSALVTDQQRALRGVVVCASLALGFVLGILATLWCLP